MNHAALRTRLLAFADSEDRQVAISRGNMIRHNYPERTRRMVRTLNRQHEHAADRARSIASGTQLIVFADWLAGSTVRLSHLDSDGFLRSLIDAWDRSEPAHEAVRFWKEEHLCEPEAVGCEPVAVPD